MNLLLDSDAAVWMLYEKEKLSHAASMALEDKSNSVAVSYASLWKITAKLARGRLPMLGSSITYMMRELDEMQIPMLRIRRAHILAMEKLEMHHGDPFDRMLIAQATVEGLTLVSADSQFRKYGVPVFW
jgi:PIN domain nuclease of toxin-antitoxin system